MTWSGRPHVDATASGAVLLSTVPTSPERGFLAAERCGTWSMLPSFPVVCLEVLGQAPQRQRLFLVLWGRCGRLSAPFTLSLTDDVNSPEAVSSGLR